MKINLSKSRVVNWSLKDYILPKRLTLKCNPIVYQWLWFQIGFNQVRRFKNGAKND